MSQVHSDAPFREYSFLDSPRIAAADKADAVHIHVEGAAERFVATPGESNASRRVLRLTPASSSAA